jgi:type I restriction enzyme S subunit
MAESSSCEWKDYSIDEIKADSNGAIAIGPFGSRMKSDCPGMTIDP